ncbi:MAG TPA: MarR family transcriptional regulator [Anaerolineae bacterium]|nr:MarR family transcriptional regulator [Anaerolineae bacterium]
MSTHYHGTPTEKQALGTYVKLSRAADAVTFHINQHLHDVNLTISQFGVLEALHHIGPLCQRDLAAKILKSSGNLTLVIDNLAKRGLVYRQRDSNDRRFINIHLTAEGAALIQELFPKHVAIVVETMNALTSDQQQQLSNLCRQLGLSLAD